MWGNLYYKLTQVSQGGAGSTNRGKRYHKVGQLCTIAKWGKSYYKEEQMIYYKVGQLLLQSGEGSTKWGNFIAK